MVDRYIRGTEADILYSCIPTADGGYIAGGYSDVDPPWGGVSFIVNVPAYTGPLPCCENRGNVDDLIGPAGPVDVSDMT